MIVPPTKPTAGSLFQLTPASVERNSTGQRVAQLSPEKPVAYSSRPPPFGEAANWVKVACSGVSPPPPRPGIGVAPTGAATELPAAGRPPAPAGEAASEVRAVDDVDDVVVPPPRLLPPPAKARGPAGAAPAPAGVRAGAPDVTRAMATRAARASVARAARAGLEAAACEQRWSTRPTRWRSRRSGSTTTTAGP